jgi:hypothetical protein
MDENTLIYTHNMINVAEQAHQNKIDREKELFEETIEDGELTITFTDYSKNNLMPKGIYKEPRRA